MAIKFEERGVLNNIPGTVTITIEAMHHNDFMKSHAGIATGGKAKAMSELLDGDSADIVLPNKFTGKELRVKAQAIKEHFARLDLKAHYLTVQTSFHPDPEQRIYPSDLVEDMRRDGIAESDIQDFLSLEKKLRKKEF